MILWEHYSWYGTIVEEELFKAYAKWAEEDGTADGIGIHTAGVLLRGKSDKSSQGNGVLMRVIPFGLRLVEEGMDFEEAMNQRVEIAEQYWQREKATLDKRVSLSIKEKKVPRTEIQLGGFGGQGIMSAGKIIGMAAAVFNNLEACFTQSYGPEARGGAAGSQVIISSSPIHHPHLTEPTSMIILSQGAYNKYVDTLAIDGVLLIDNELVKLPEDHRTDIKTLGIPATKIAEEAGNNRAANTVMLGFWTAVEEIVDKKAMEESIAESVPPKTVDLNLDVFRTGYQEGLAQG